MLKHIVLVYLESMDDREIWNFGDKIVSVLGGSKNGILYYPSLEDLADAGSSLAKMLRCPESEKEYLNSCTIANTIEIFKDIEKKKNNFEVIFLVGEKDFICEFPSLWNKMQGLQEIKKIIKEDVKKFSALIIGTKKGENNFVSTE